MKKAAAAEFMCQWRECKQTGPIAHPVRPYVFAWGRHRRSQDIVDNFPGTFYDAFVDAEILRGDSAKWCPGSFHEMIHSPSPPRVDILLAPWLSFSQSIEQFAEIRRWLAIQQ
jgi:hypothetical protein